MNQLANQPHSQWRQEETYQAYLASLLAADRQSCFAIFQQCLDSEMPLRDLYVNVVQRSLYEIGDLWMRGEVSLAVEHLATAITESVLGIACPRLFAGKRLGKLALVACVPNDHHRIGGRIVADYFELSNWRSYFLGANTPVSEMLSVMEQRQPDVLVLSATASFNFGAVVAAAAEIREAFPSLPILAGGQAVANAGCECLQRLPGVKAMASLEELNEWIKENSRHA